MCHLPQLKHVAGHRLGLLWLCLATGLGQAAPVELSPQTVTLPANAGDPFFADITGSGRCDLFVMDEARKQLWYYRQRPDSFADAPDEIIPLPPQTAWAALCDVDPHPGLELLMSTATGLVYSRQNAAGFELERHALITASQIFTNNEQPLLISLTNSAEMGALIPVISAERVVFYHRNSAYEWSPGPPVDLAARQTKWFARRAQFPGWALGASPAHSLRVYQTVQPQLSPEEQDEQPENEAIGKLLADLKKATGVWPPQMFRFDVNGDGREDLIVCQVSRGMDAKTDLYVFLRGADGKLPARPAQVLHARGFPIPVGSTMMPSAVADLNHDGVYALVLLEIKLSALSVNGALQTILTRGIDWSLTVRPFRNGAFAHSPEAAVPVTGILPSQLLLSWPVFIQGDFNGDGRPDLLVRRSDTQWDIFPSTTDGHWFEPQPAITFAAPVHGDIEIKDLNGDGRSDIIWHDPAAHRLLIFLSPSPPAKGKKP